MTHAREAEDSSAKEMAVLLDQVMRGKKVLLIPPGAVVAALSMVALSMGIVGLVPMIGALALSIGVTTVASSTLELLGCAVLVLGPIAGQLLVIFGHPTYGRRLLLYVRLLWIAAALLTLASAVGWLNIVWWTGLVAIVGLGGSHELLRSRSYSSVIAFFSLKRDYRLHQAAARERVLGRRS